MPEKGYSQRTKIRDKGSFPKVPDCHGYNSYIGVDPPGHLPSKKYPSSYHNGMIAATKAEK